MIKEKVLVIDGAMGTMIQSMIIPVKTNTFGAIPWVLDEYQFEDKTYEIAKAGAKIVKEACKEYLTPEKPRFIAGSLGPGTKLPSLGHIYYDEMYEGYKTAGLDMKARKYLNSVFLHHCIEAGLTMAIVNPKHLIPIHKISEGDKMELHYLKPTRYIQNNQQML